MIGCGKLSLFIGVMALSLLASVWSRQAGAVDLMFTANFRPDAANPTNNKFVNTTPLSGYCGTWSDLCTNNEVFGIAIEMGTISFEHMDVNGADRNSAYFRVPAGFHDVTVRNETGSEAILKWRANAMSARIDNAREVFQLAGWVTWSSPEPPCSYVTTAVGGGWHEFIWRVPEGSAPCIKKPAGEVSMPMLVSRFSIGYELSAPDPLSMRNGVYTGTLNLTMGPGGDFDFGDRATVTESVVTLHFTLTVQHELKVDFSPGGQRAVLVPEGGWNHWVDHGRLPTSLTKDLPFSLSSSAPFSVTLECEHPQPNGNCGLRNATNPAAPMVPVAVAITMPGFRETQRNLDALNLKLSTHGITPRFLSDAYAVNRASRLHFDVTGEHVKSILDHPGDQYRGNVTVVFDAQP